MTDKLPDEPAIEHGGVRVVLGPGKRARVWYTNWRGETSIREIEFDGFPVWSSTDWHPEDQWLITGIDLIKNERRVWAIKDMRPVT